MFRFFLFIAILILLIPGMANAKMDYELSTFALSDDNMYHTPLPQGGQTFGLFSVKAAYTDGSNFSAYLKGEDLLYGQTSQLNGFIGTLNADYRFVLGEYNIVKFSAKYRARNFSDANRTGSGYGAGADFQQRWGDVFVTEGYSYEKVASALPSFAYQSNHVLVSGAARLFSTPGSFALSYRYGFGSLGEFQSQSYTTQIISAQVFYPFVSISALIGYDYQSTRPQGQLSYTSNILYGGLVYRF